MKIIYDVDQGSEEWHKMRLGKVTASKLKDLMTKGRGSAPSKTRESYMMELIAERLTGEAAESFTSSAMEWGIKTEPQARAMYEFSEGVDVEKCTFIEVDENFGVSPDGLVGDNGLLEIKCPKTTTQIKRYLAGEFPKEYKDQVQGQLLASEREWCDFVSFDPRIDGPAGYFKVRVNRDEEYIKTMQSEIDKFVSEMLEIIEKLNSATSAGAK